MSCSSFELIIYHDNGFPNFSVNYQSVCGHRVFSQEKLNEKYKNAGIIPSLLGLGLAPSSIFQLDIMAWPFEVVSYLSGPDTK